jgi:hypothetical protein
MPDEFVGALERAVKKTKSGQPALLDCKVKAGFDFSKYQGTGY